ncbi:hypothetical protein G6045_11195 [Streptomyces sp. YC504]|uniref:O-antigen ligase family protein n=1 Tax=Streptomyces mesophilus TaxID=1775132 RepID=A0A6G4XFQ2_9ACTN|nr:hypothetical protein [Streptomyces mesophilus]NGO76228.1 hypothetical protein [Streptomyces mesophilus]
MNLTTACAGILLVGLLTWSVHRWPLWGLALFTVQRMLWEGLTNDIAPLVESGIGLMPSDVVCVALVASATVRLVGAAHPGGPARIALVALAALVMLSLLRGFLTFGVAQPGNEARAAFLQVCCVALFAATLPDPKAALRAVARCWVVVAMVLCVLATVWWGDIGIGSSSTVVYVGGERRDARPLGSPEALFIAQAALMLLCGVVWPRLRWLAWPLLATVVLLQHRSAWVAAAVMLVGFALSRKARARFGLRPLMWLGSAALVALLTLAATAGGTLWSELAASGTDDKTLVWRFNGWAELLPHLGTLVDWLIGLPFGSGYLREVNGMFINLSPHNHYVATLLRLGLLGVLLLLAIHAAVWKAVAVHPHGGLFRVVLAGQLVFLITNTSYPEQALLLGVLIACARPAAPVTPLPALLPSPSHAPLEQSCRTPAVPR